MKLLLDENLSRRIVPSLQASYPDTSHVSLLGLERADDRAIWTFAKVNDYVIVTKDDDFQGLLALFGHPPKVIRLLMGNCSNQEVVAALCANTVTIAATLAASEVGLVDLHYSQASTRTK
jgi:predicted nuclease of predicted toxin-antitoxin system